MTASISIVGIACCYPDARNPAELWENILAQRRAFRRMPNVRLRLADYLSNNREAPDCLYSTTAALIEGYEFDRSGFRVAGSTFRSADLTHWLALDVAAQVLEDAGFPEARGLPRDNTGVFLGNTLTGEFSRANALRLRWPYVRRTLESALLNEDWSDEHRNDFLRELERAYKKPFAPVDEDSLAGGLSNTIAGRICNHFDFHGGGYTVDGACASSLVAVANACSALAAGELDVVLAGGVDLSLDPFELVGFAKAGALATDEMRVYDESSNGFWPGEGCGFALLMRSADALAQRLRVYAQIKGWAISSDGHGGITRPDVEGQVLALRRAYARAGFDIRTVSYFEGHGTGTSVGDSTELKALSRTLREANDREVPAAAIGSIKANIGHTKAAAGIAGLIKSVLALHHRVIPPTTGCTKPFSECRSKSAVLRTVKRAELWPADRDLRAGVSAMGFGGINAHVVLEADKTEVHPNITDQHHFSTVYGTQDAELFLFSAQNVNDLRSDIDRLLTFAAELSHAELLDLAAHLGGTLDSGYIRAAVLASTPAELVQRLKELRSVVVSGVNRIDTKRGVFFGITTAKPPRIGFLFPGQGSPSHLDGGALRTRFDFVDQLYLQSQFDTDSDSTATAIAQPAIVTASIGALRVLNKLNITAQVAVGHSLGELTALHWGGAIAEDSLLRIARVRGLAMTGPEIPAGAMASLATEAQRVQSLLNSEGVYIGALNSLRQTVISGPVESVDKILALAQAKGIKATKLPVSLAFHSQLVKPAASLLAPHLANEHFSRLQRNIVSTVTGEELSETTNLPNLLYRQITAPVRFLEAVTRADSNNLDLWLEVGPGHVLNGIIGDITQTPCVSLDAGGDSLRGLLTAAGAAFVMGQPIKHRALFADRFTRPFDLNWKPKFFVNPCELAPVPKGTEPHVTQAAEETGNNGTEQEFELITTGEPDRTSVLKLVRELVAERAELPVATVDPQNRFLSDLHLNSITVSQLIAESTRRLSLPTPISPTDFADAKISEVAEFLEKQLKNGPAAESSDADALPAGFDTWVKAFKVELVEAGPLLPPASHEQGCWHVFAVPDDPFAKSLRFELARRNAGDGIVVCLPPEPDETVLNLLLPAARLALQAKEKTRFVLVQRSKGAASFARTLYLEAPRVNTCVINLSSFSSRAVEWVITEALAARGYVEVHYDEDGHRYEPVVKPLALDERSGTLPIARQDLLIVTGGGKGITAECALALAKESSARLVLIGRAEPESDEELSANLKRFTASGIDFRYVSVDVTDAARVREVVQKIVTELGPVTGILHGAARNVPQLLSTLDEESFRKTLAVKVQGARNLLAAINPEKLRLLVTFGSIIARTGLAGEADYGLANEWLAHLTEEWSVAHTGCRCLTLEWSVWSGQGMGARLGRTRLMQQGVTPISPQQGVAIFRDLLVQSLPLVSVVVMSRFRDLPTFKIECPELPFLRFLDEPRFYVQAVELIADVNLSADSDPYLNDHQFQGENLLPAVMGLEAMAQAAMAVAGATEPPVLEDVHFTQPVIVPAAKSLRVRIVALRQGANYVDVALRSSETAFQVNHFQARCHFASNPNGSPLLFNESATSDRVAIDPIRDLYGDLLFHTGRFRRLANYRLLKAKECIAEISPDARGSWFSQYFPDTLVLGDPGARDAAIHAIQACIPHMTLLPTGIERLTIERTASAGPLVIYAQERFADGNTFVYDLLVKDEEGNVHERWDGLRLNAVSHRSTKNSWITSLLAVYLERRIRELLPTSELSVAFVQDEVRDRAKRGAVAFGAMLGEEEVVLKRPDGKPEVANGKGISAAHHDNLTLAVAGPAHIGCDLEKAVYRPLSVWRALIGEEGISLVWVIQSKVKESREVSATRVWAAKECLKKAGAIVNAPLVFVSTSSDGWIILSSGLSTIATYQAQLRNRDGKFVIAILASASQTNMQYEDRAIRKVRHATL